MSFSTIPFLFVFFPVSLVLFYVFPKKLRSFLLVLLSLVFYSWGDIKNLPILLFSLFFNYLAGLEIAAWKERQNSFATKLAVWVSAGVDVAILCFYKYVAKTLPIGISFYTFSVLSYLFDVYRDKADGEKNIITMALYVTFFPKLISGPIIRYSDFREQIDHPRINKKSFAAGTELFIVGLFKKVLIADRLGSAFNSVFALGSMSAGRAWLGMIFYSLQLYFDFSGYSDMAIGLARIVGFKFEKNFDYPYKSTNISEFWRRWHISLGAWFREYVYIPLGGNRCGPVKQFRNLAVVWLLTGAWHGSTLNFLFWGIYHGTFVILERFVIRDSLDKVPRGVRTLVTDLLVFIGWIFFFCPSLGSSFGYLGKMFGLDGLGFWDRTASYYLFNNLILLIAAVVLCGPAIRSLQERMITRHPSGAMVGSIVLYGVLLAFCIAGMVNATYSTFLYFQF